MPRIIRLILAIMTLFMLAGTTSIEAPKSVLAASMPGCPQPPANVDLSTLSDAQLRVYGLPHRPTSGPLEAWQNALRHAKIRHCQSGGYGLKHTDPLRLKPNTSEEQFTNWAGNVAITQGYAEAYAGWNEPCLTLRLKTAYSATWVGLGGDPYDGGGNLVQSGTESDEYQDGFGRFVQREYAWIEDYPDDPTQVIAPFSVSCGQTMFADDWQDYRKPVKPLCLEAMRMQGLALA